MTDGNDDFHYSGSKKDDNNNNNNNNGKHENLYFLLPTGKLKEEQIVTKFVAKPTNGKRVHAGFIELELNHKYDRKTIISDIYDDNWIKTIKLFSDRAKQKGISKAAYCYADRPNGRKCWQNYRYIRNSPE